MSRVERIMARRQIVALIKSDPIDIVVSRKSKIEAPGGGWRWSGPLDLSPQMVTIVPFKRRMTEFLVNTELGDMPDLPYVVIGFHTLDIQREDIFKWQGDTFEVKTVDIKHEVRIAAQVDYYAGSNLNG